MFLAANFPSIQPRQPRTATPEFKRGHGLHPTFLKINPLRQLI